MHAQRAGRRPCTDARRYSGVLSQYRIFSDMNVHRPSSPEPNPECMLDPHAVSQALEWLQEADGVIVAAGAGMGVDSGLPDFRGNEGMWHAYPALGRVRMDFTAIASPDAFRRNARLAWGFYGHRLALYRATTPHGGFDVLRRWAKRMAHGAFVYTSNVDGHFQKAGFSASRVAECHGRLHQLQCMEACRMQWWPADDWEPVVDAAACELRSPLPTCPDCGGLARPNVLMFNDYGWVPELTELQLSRLETWLTRVRRPVVVELGAGTAVPSVRWFSTSLQAPVIRINLRESQIDPKQGVGLAGTALEVLNALDARWGGGAATLI